LSRSKIKLHPKLATRQEFVTICLILLKRNVKTEMVGNKVNDEVCGCARGDHYYYDVL
jgi:hypothetical protein